MKRALRMVGIVLLAIAAILLVLFIYHRVRLKSEAALLFPIGTPVDVDGGKMNVYTEGEGSETLVFMSGGGTCSPVLDFKALYSQLSGDYKIAVVEKFGYGFSSSPDMPRDIDTILDETRSALEKAGVEGPYILCPHSMSGIEALRWAQKYPEDARAIIGLDMAVPAAYEDMKISLPMLRLGRFGVSSGIARLIPGLADGDAVKHGLLTEGEKDIYRALFYRQTASAPMLAEAAAIKESAALTASFGRPQLPMLMFISDGTGGTGFETEQWRSIQKDYLSGIEGGEYVELDCPHYVHDHEYMAISVKMRDFISGLERQ